MINKGVGKKLKIKNYWKRTDREKNKNRENNVTKKEGNNRTKREENKRNRKQINEAKKKEIIRGKMEEGALKNGKWWENYFKKSIWTPTSKDFNVK